MDGKETTKKVWKKTGFGIMFVAACFIAMYILVEFHGDVLMVSIAAALLLISAFLFLNAVFSDKAKKWDPEEEEFKEAKEVLSSGGDGEFRLKITKHMKEMESTQKELIDVLKNQNKLLLGQIENLEHEIYMLSEKQVNQTKSVIKFNKENARQLAISERETLEYVMTELKKAIEDNAGPVAAREVAETSPVADEPLNFAEEQIETAAVAEMEELAGIELFEVSDLPGDDEFVMPDLLAQEEPDAEPESMVQEEMEIPEMPENVDISELFDIPELFEDLVEESVQEEVPVVEELPTMEEIPVVEELPSIEEIPVLEDLPPIEEIPAVEAAEEKAEETASAASASDPLAGLGGDPNAMMSPEDIAKLLEAMGQ